jgi:hypothetical protein
VPQRRLLIGQYEDVEAQREERAIDHQGDHRAALSAASDGLNTAEKTGQRQWDVELKRIEGVALSGLNRLEEGERALAEAIGIAQTQKAKALNCALQ